MSKEMKEEERLAYEHAVRSSCDHCPAPDEAPMPEGFEYTCCVPTSLALARQAITFAENGLTSEAWRKEAAGTSVPAGSAVAQAEHCMHSSGLWPWEREV